ncbi:cache domain-containing sensor histidine kinase [Cellulosilyticum sp. I15G10I2]|uniref:cache domain-containing sensor histidine kinase n=1 Tax=Cellulosilyticum sp. I15G10I2 TaxID=1892843 RepID=UPI00085BF415|nr:sensor histidine kinase [Cellulosilyticum sp. I15G10I2]
MITGFNSIKNRILIFFLAIIFIPIVTLGLFANTVYSRSIETSANKHTAQMISQIQSNIEYYLQSIDNIMYYISQSPDVVQYLTDDSEPQNNDLLEIRVRTLLNIYTEANPEIAGILIVNTRDKYLSNELIKNNRDPLLQEDWYLSAVNQSDISQYASKPIGRNLNTYSEYSADEVISISRTMRHPKTNEITGVILIDMKLGKFEEIIKNNNIGQKGFFYILDKNNDIVYSPVNPIIYRINNEWFKDISNLLIKSINNETFEIMCETSVQTGWRTIGVFSIEEILEDVLKMQTFAMFVSGFTLILAIVVAIIFTNTIVTPIKELTALMKRAEQGDLEVSFENNKYKDEFGELGHSFNHMIKEIKQLIEMVYTEQRNKRKAELKILQAQIKPHFLYNTLDTIQWMAVDYGARDIVEIVTALTKLFRIALSKGREVITIREEIDHIESYMIIQKARYEDKLSYDITYDEELLDKPILKLTAQPIVENAIYHGVKQKRGAGKVEINFSKIDHQVIITVTDNGAGIDALKLHEINMMLQHENIRGVASESGSGYGICNVHTRIKMTYGSEYGLRYISKVNEGTCVQIILPLLEA